MFIFLLLSATFVLLASTSLAEKRASVSIQPYLDGTHDASFEVLVVVKNEGDEKLVLINDPHTVLSSHWPTKLFDISGPDGTSPRFIGVKAKFEPLRTLRTSIAPGDSVELVHSLNKSYDFSTFGGSSQLVIAPSQSGILFTHVSPDGSLQKVQGNITRSHILNLPTAIQRRNPRPTVDSSPLRSRALTFAGCSSSRQTILPAAASNAQAYASSSYQYLTGVSAATPRWTAYFGAYSASYKATAQSVYQRISNRQLSRYTFDCTCTDASTYSYVYPDDAYTVYLCGLFWESPATGTDSQAGDLIHDASEFNVNGGADDGIYSPGCSKLQPNCTKGSVRSAMAYERFAENNPPLA